MIYEKAMHPRRMNRHTEMGDISYMALVGMKYKEGLEKYKADRSSFIIETVCAWFGLTDREITRKCRERKYVFPRQMAMYLLKHYTNMSLRDIGIRLGGLDHTSVIHSCQLIKNLMFSDESIRNTIQALENKIQ